MFKRHRRILWLLNHKTLMQYEVPLLVEMGFEVFVPKVTPQDAAFRSASVSHQWDSTLSLPDEVLKLLNEVDFYDRLWSPEVVRFINQYFGAVFIIPFGLQTLEALRHFEGRVLFRAFGLENGKSYGAVLAHLHGIEVLERIKAAGDRFWFAAGYDQLKECEPRILVRRGLFLPIGLPSSYWRREGTWRGGSGKILFVCPNLVTNPYYARLYGLFKSEFGHLPHVIVGAQDVPTTDPDVRGFVTDDELIELYQTSAALYYPSRERRHLHYSPIEAMITGTPVVFHDDCLLSRLAGRMVAGAVKDSSEALVLLRALIEDTGEVRARIVDDQRDIPRCFSDEFCKPQWRLEIKRSGLGSQGRGDGGFSRLWREIGRRLRLTRKATFIETGPRREPVRRREIAGPAASEGDPQEGIDFSQEELPLFLCHFEGLSEPDSWGRWSDGSSVKLSLETPLHGRVSIEVVGGAYGANLNCPISVKCGDAVGVLSFGSPPWEPETKTLSMEFKKPCSTIEILVPHPTCLEEGQRSLGLGLCRMRFVAEQKGVGGSSSVRGTEADREGILRRIRGRWEAVNRLDQCILKSYKPTCLVCGYSARVETFAIREAECVFGGGRLERYECPECGCVFGPRKVIELHPAVLAQDYKDLYATYSEADSTHNEIRAFHALSPRKGGVYLNYGSGGWSKSASMLNEEGYEVHAYDPFYKGSHPNMLTKKGLKERRFDGIYSNNVIEHFTKPIETFLFLRSLLKRGGSMSHATACYDYLYDYTRFHTVFFTGISVQILSSKTKLRLGDRQREGEFICQVFHRPWW